MKDSDLQSRLRKIQQDKSKNDEQVESEDIDEMIKLVMNEPYKDSTTYYKPNLMEQIIPDCYKDIKFNEQKFDLYKEETLFYIFYVFPGAEIQKSAFTALIKKGYMYSKFYRCFVFFKGNKIVDNTKHLLTMFDPFNWSKIKREVMFDEKFVYTLENKL